MEFSHITYQLYWVASAAWLLVALVQGLLCSRQTGRWPLAVAFFFNSLWLLDISFRLDGTQFSFDYAILMEILRYALWIFCILYTLQLSQKQQLPFLLRFLVVISLGIAILCAAISLTLIPELQQPLWLVSWNGLLLTVICLISVEQLYRNSALTRQDKLIFISIAGLFIFDLGLHLYTLVFFELNEGLLQARASIAICATLLILIALLKFSSGRASTLAFSRPVAFYSMSLTLSVVLAVVVLFGGFYVKSLGGEWGTVIYTVMLFTAFMLVTVIFASSTIRGFIKVTINKHLFQHKYDYRTEWLRLIQQLALPATMQTAPARVVEAVQTITGSPKAALWIKRPNKYELIYRTEIPNWVELDSIAIDNPFCRTMEEDQWLYIPNAVNDPLKERHNNLIPEKWLRMPGIWLILPLMLGSKLTGFILLTEPKHDTSLTWEDLDLLKTVGRQLANFIERLSQQERLVEAEQFQTFQKLSAFIMHDLKNLIAQQALVVSNADKHKHKPEFVDDAMSTIKNSVDRMQALLKKLQFSGSPSIKTFSVHQVLRDSVQGCLVQRPRPALRLIGDDRMMTADVDQLQMTLTNLLKNAQDATPTEGFIDVIVDNEGPLTIIKIEDNGSGMDNDFIRSRLFKPFETTKAGKGMGIGMYLAQEFILSLNGTIDVHSVPGEGTTFTISLPTETLTNG